MFLTKKNLEDLGCKNVVGIPEPVAIINDNAYPARIRMFKNLDRFKSEDIFINARDGALLIIYDNSDQDIDLENYTGKVMLRLFNFDKEGV